MKRTFAVVGLVLLVLVGFFLFRLGNQGDDTAMIQETLRQSLQASREGKAGGVLDTLSKSLTVNNQEADGNFSQIANFIKNQKPNLVVTNPNPIVSGDEATITSPVEIKTSLPIVGDRTVTVKDVVMTFRRETARAYFVIPVKKWRLVQVQAPPMAMDTLGIQ